ncbi:glycosyltransferase [Angustibacter luteus]|uniref:Glycosyltransferase n=1 Tax=Angustibacter luteus TaxID=658456 RepID=A0ABW1JD16_9ACTN
MPSGHVYVRHLSPPAAPTGSLVRLPDPSNPWWPPVALDAGWIRAHADTFDLMHVHFGFDALAPAELAAIVAALREAGKPLVLTVHDLRNPHHPTRHLHDEQLGVLVPAADALLTLTEGAAREIQSRWGRRALVVPHPHVLDLAEMGRRERSRSDAPPTGGDFLVGVHLKSMRACMSGVPVVNALLHVVDTQPGVRLRVDAHRDIVEPAGARYQPQLAATLERAAGSGADVRVHDYFSDSELWDYLSDLDLSVLPYRFGTHSGWLEACRDLGTAVAAPRCGYYADQGAIVSFDLDEHALDVTSLAQAVAAARSAGPPEPLSVAFRTEQRADIAATHARVYAALLP